VLFGASSCSELTSEANDAVALSKLGDLVDFRSDSLSGLEVCVNGEYTGSLVSEGLKCLEWPIFGE